MSQETGALVESTHVPVKARLEWIDVAKGIAITLVVLGHVVWVLTLMDVPTSDFWRRVLKATAPMRMPGFFMMSGLFAHRFATGSFEKFARRRVIGFVYLFAVWLLVTMVVEVGLKLWLGSTAGRVSRTDMMDHVLQLETPLWYLIALPVFHLLWWCSRCLPAWVPLLITGIGYMLVDLRIMPLPGALASTGIRGMIHYAFFFMIGARLSHLLRDVVGHMRPWMSGTIVLAWLAMEQWLPTLPLKSIVAVPALFAFSQLIVLTPLKGWAQRAGRRTLPLYLMNWLTVSIVGGVWLAIDVPTTRLMQFLVPGITLPVVVALITAVWHLTRNVDVLWRPPAALENGIVNACRALTGRSRSAPQLTTGANTSDQCAQFRSPSDT